MRALAVAVVVLAVGCTVTAPATSPTTAPTGAPNSPTQSSSQPAVSAIAAVGNIVESRSDVARNAVDAASDEQLAETVAADRTFAFDLYRSIAADEPGNLFLSPYSISTALSMVLAGARGETAQELANALHVGDNGATWHAARNRLELQLLALADYEPVGNPDAVPLTLEPTNAFFGQTGYPFEQDYLDILAANYGAGVHGVDFSATAEPSREAINAWVAERTRDRIEELIPPGVIDSSTVAVLVNAIYFKATWLLQFDPGRTQGAPFHLLDGSTVDVELMHDHEKRQYAAGDGWQAVELPYVGGASMVVIVPEQGRFAEVEAQLDDEFLSGLDSSLSEHLVDLRLPRWNSESDVDLKPPLRSLGVERLFSASDADLTGIADAGLFVSDAIHAANITVDERGTEAAAATAVGIADSAAPPATLTADRPFIYLIRDDANGAILFLGRLLQP